MRYIDCTLTIQDMENLSIEYIDGEKIREKEGKLVANKVDMLTVERLNYWINYGLQVQEKAALQGLIESKGVARTENPTSLEDLKLIGLLLYKILFNDKSIESGFKTAYQNFKKSYQDESDERSSDLRFRLKLVFLENVEKLSNLPWEFIFIPADEDGLEGDFLSGQLTEMLLTRYVPRSRLVSDLSLKEEQLRILVLVCSPSKLGSFDESEIDKLLSKMQSIPHVKVTILHNLTYQELSDMINQDEISKADKESLYKKLATGDLQADSIKNPPFHILHFVGHGESEGIYLIKDPDDDDYDPDQGENQQMLYSAVQFRKIFYNAKRKPRMVFLHACKGASQSQEGFKSTARQLVYAEIPAVVAMQYSISHSDAGIFAQKFYEELGKGKGIDEAVKEGRIKLGNRNPPWGHPRFGTPVVYLQSEIANELVKPLAESEPPADRTGTKVDISPMPGRASPAVDVQTATLSEQKTKTAADRV
jgi:hypothetical protein